MVPGGGPGGSLGAILQTKPTARVERMHNTNCRKSANGKSDGSRISQVSNSLGSGWICSRATRMRQCQASTLGVGGGEWGGRHPDDQGHPDAKSSLGRVQSGDSGRRTAGTHLSREHRLGLQSKTHRRGHKAEMRVSIPTAPSPIFTSITSPGWSHSYSDKSQKNGKRTCL